VVTLLEIPRFSLLSETLLCFLMVDWRPCYTLAYILSFVQPALLRDTSRSLSFLRLLDDDRRACMHFISDSSELASTIFDCTLNSTVADVLLLASILIIYTSRLAGCIEVNKQRHAHRASRPAARASRAHAPACVRARDGGKRGRESCGHQAEKLIARTRRHKTRSHHSPYVERIESFSSS